MAQANTPEESDSTLARQPDPDRQPGPDKQSGLTPVMAAAVLGGTMAAAAGAYFGTRALARRNREQNGRPINSVMAAAITACDLAHDKEGPEPLKGAKDGVGTKSG